MIQIIIRSSDGITARLEYAKSMILKGLEGGAVVMELKRENRTLAQNRKLWPMLADVSGQVEWYDRRLADEDWKDIFTAALKGSDVVPGIDGKMVVLGLHSSKLNKQEFSDLIELIHAFGAEHDVVWGLRDSQNAGG